MTAMFVADDVDQAWDELGRTPAARRDDGGVVPARRGALWRASAPPPPSTELRDDPSYRIVTVDEAIELHPGRHDPAPAAAVRRSGPEVAWPYLRRAAEPSERARTASETTEEHDMTASQRRSSSGRPAGSVPTRSGRSPAVPTSTSSGCGSTSPEKVGRDAGELAGIDPLGIDGHRRRRRADRARAGLRDLRGERSRARRRCGARLRTAAAGGDQRRHDDVHRPGVPAGGRRGAPRPAATRPRRPAARRSTHRGSSPGSHPTSSPCCSRRCRGASGASGSSRSR